MDNATNNDTMVEAIERKCQAENIPFSAQHSRLRCMPHTVHLAALKASIEYFKLPVESFQTCDPINWWYMRRHNME
jgi:hypothetical protein